MRKAKDQFTDAALACLRNDPSAEKKTHEALQAIDVARGEGKGPENSRSLAHARFK